MGKLHTLLPEPSFLHCDEVLCCLELPSVPPCGPQDSFCQPRLQAVRIEESVARTSGLDLLHSSLLQQTRSQNLAIGEHVPEDG